MTSLRAIFSSEASSHLAGSQHQIDAEPASRYFTVRFAQATFNAEGSESAGRFFSRRISWPGGAMSGVTIGRGYDMGSRTQSQVTRELTLAGVPQGDAIKLSRAAGLRGRVADTYVRTNSSFSPVLSLEAQHRLFEDVTVPETIRDIKRIFTKPDTVATYGAIDWDSLPLVAQELVFDLRYRGDYTPTTRQRLQPILANQEWRKLPELMNDTAYWSRLGVPPARIQERAALVSELALAADVDQAA